MCNNNEHNNCESCIADILKVILLLQGNVCNGETCLDSCDRGYLGQNIATLFNTRPIVLYTYGSNNTPVEMPISKDITETTTSPVFRIEKLNNCCATCRVLSPNPDETATNPFVSTNSFFTIDLNSVSMIRCLNDTYVDLS